MSNVKACSPGEWDPRLELLSWSEFSNIPRHRRIVVIPAGAIEQHGHHLPLCTDAMNVEAVAFEATKVEEVLLAPTLDYGVSTNHLMFAGTISLRQQTLVSLLVDIAESLFSHDVPAVLILNGNGGNADAMRFACGEIRRAFPDRQVGYSDIGEMRPEVQLDSGIVYHADETETSHSLYVCPASVRKDLITKEITPAFLEHYQRYYDPSADLHGVVSYGLPPTKVLTDSGVMGDPMSASPEKGEQWHSALVANVRRAIADLRRRAAP